MDVLHTHASYSRYSKAGVLYSAFFILQKNPRISLDIRGYRLFNFNKFHIIKIYTSCAAGCSIISVIDQGIDAEIIEHFCR